METKSVIFSEWMSIFLSLIYIKWCKLIPISDTCKYPYVGYDTHTQPKLGYECREIGRMVDGVVAAYVAG